VGLPAGPNGGRRDQVIYYQYKADRARRTLRGIDEQVAKAEKTIAGQVPVKRNRFIRLSGGTRTVNRELQQKARALAGLKGYITNRRLPPAVPDREKLPDGQKRPAGPARLPPHPRLDRSAPDHRVRRARGQPLDPALHRMVHPQVRQDRPRYRAIQIQAGPHTVAAADPLPGDQRDALAHIHGRMSAYYLGSWHRRRLSAASGIA
jgi:hypothetical protein